MIVIIPARLRDRDQLVATLNDLSDKAERLHTGAHTQAGHLPMGPWRVAFEALKDEIERVSA